MFRQRLSRNEIVVHGVGVDDAGCWVRHRWIVEMIISALQTPLLLATTSVLSRLSPIMTVMLSPERAPEPFTFTGVPGGPLERSNLKPAPKVKLTCGTLLRRVSEPEARMR